MSIRGTEPGEMQSLLKKNKTRRRRANVLMVKWLNKVVEVILVIINHIRQLRQTPPYFRFQQKHYIYIVNVIGKLKIHFPKNSNSYI